MLENGSGRKKSNRFCIEESYEGQSTDHYGHNNGKRWPSSGRFHCG
jgi:hypothetical protein